MNLIKFKKAIKAYTTKNIIYSLMLKTILFILVKLTISYLYLVYYVLNTQHTQGYDVRVKINNRSITQPIVTISKRNHHKADVIINFI